MFGWIGVDLDGTLAEHDGCSLTIGAPIAPMVLRVRQWLKDGVEVRIVTARYRPEDLNNDLTVENIQRWCLRHLGTILQVTNAKDFMMRELWDDRAVTVEANTGRVLTSGRT